MASFGHDIIFIVEISFFGDRRMLYRMAGYCRLSKEDGENRISESIENQKKLILEYVDKAGDMQTRPNVCGRWIFRALFFESTTVSADDGRYLQGGDPGRDHKRYFQTGT